ncbi:MAG: FAD-dependent monooxygenase [Bacteroidaceae bacterium]|nr:FAD-dependent monooxygenase [Bacteroidaceae bacterium]
MISEYQIRVLPQQAFNEQSIKDYIARFYALDARTIHAVRVLKRSIDARQRTIYVNLTVRIYINELPTDDEFVHTEYRDVSDKPEVIIVGAGPGGLFAALRLIELGFRPVVLERGKDVHSRKRDIARISREHQVNPESNYSFGEGGAGAYSDGKLYTRSKKRGNSEKILHVFCQHGASVSILSDAHPHIGTDKLPRVIENMRNTILTCGGEVHFETKMTSIIVEKDRVVGVTYQTTKQTPSLPQQAEPHFQNKGEGSEATLEGYKSARAVILSTGHSARDVYRWMHSNKIEMEAKGIAMGVRLEHPAELIDQIQYHSRAGRGRWLPAAEYSFVTQVEGRGVYSFCMCPGGFVVPAASGPEQVVVNGMSPSGRNGKWSNSGMVVEIRPDDIEGDDVLRVMKYQERLERDAWQMGGRRQTAPAQRMADFVKGKLSYDLPSSSYSPGLVSSPLHFWMPQEISQRLARGFEQFERHSRGFLTNEACIIGVETRTSSPIRILRDKDTLQHIRIHGLFPCGEGAGYAGGIVSAGVDGERCAEMAAEYLKQ